MGTLNLKSKVVDQEDRKKKTALVEQVNQFEPQVVLDAEEMPYIPQQVEEEFQESQVDQVEDLDEKGKKKKKKKPKKGKNDGVIRTQDQAEKYYRNLKIRKISILVVILLVCLSMVGFGVYNTFVKQEKTPQQIAAEVNQLNNDTAFPEAGVQGWLAENVSALIGEKSSFSEKSGNVAKISDLYVTNVIKKSPTIANVYFTAVVGTDTGSEQWNMYMPVSYDFTTLSYEAAGSLEVTPVASAADRGELAENPFLSFEGLSKVGEDTLASATTFLDNFYTILYNQKGDVSTFYKGNKALAANYTGTYKSIDSLNVYTSNNPNGFNAVCVFYMQYDNGIAFTNTMYLNMEMVGDTWRITNIM